MSMFGGARVEIQLDATQAERLLRDLLKRIARADARVTVRTEAANITRAIEGAVKAADTGIIVTGDARDVTSTIEGSIDAADTGVEVTGDARDVTSSVEGAIDAADTGVEVTGDARDVTSSVEGAIDAADTGVVVVGDAREVTSSIEGAIDAADTGVVVTGTATSLTPAIEGAVDAADTSVTIDADPTPLRRVAQASDNLGLSLTSTRLSYLKLTNVIRGGIIAVAAKQFFDAAQAASALVEAQTKAEAVFRDSVGVVEQFGRTASTSVALSETAALGATGTFGNLFTALGLTRQEAAKLSPDVVRLATDFASFNNLNVDDTLIAIQAGLVGEIEPLRRLGVSFNAAQVEAKALELGLAASREELTEGAKVQARWALITEQSKNVAGDFARTSEGLANQQRILQAEFQNAVTEIGQGFLPVMLDLVRLARDEGIPAFQDLATAGGSVLVAGLEALIPLLGTTTRLLVALEPALTAVATVVEAIPDPVLQMAGAWLLFSRVVGPLGSIAARAATGLGGLGVAAATNAANLGLLRGGAATAVDSLSALRSVITPTNLGIAALTAGFILWTNAQQKEQRIAADVERQTDSFAAALSEAETAVEGITAALENAFRAGEDFTVDIKNAGGEVKVTNDLLSDAGLTAESFGELVAKGSKDVNRFALELLGANDKGLELSIGLTGLSDQFQEGARRTLDAEVALGTYTRTQVRSAIEQATGAGEARNYAGALNILKEEVAANAEAAEAEAEAQAALNENLRAAVQAAPGLAEALRQIQVPGGNVATEFARIAVEAGRANLSQDQMAAVAERLGVELEDLAPNIQAVIDVLDGITQTALGGIPGLSDLSGQIEDLNAVSLPLLRDTLQKMFDDYSAFNDNLALIAAEAPILTQIAAQSPQIAATIAQGIRDGKTAAIDELELLALGVGQEQARLPGIIDANAPGIADAARRSGQLTDSAFLESLRPDATARTKFDQARINIRAAKEGLSVESTGAGTAAASGFDAGSSTVPDTAKKRMDEARTNIRAAKEGMTIDASGTGSGAASGYATGMQPVPGTAAARLAEARRAIIAERELHRAQGAATAGAAEGAYRAGMSPIPRTAGARMREAKDAIAASSGVMKVAGAASGAGGAAGFTAGLAISQARINAIVRAWKKNIIAGVGAIFEFGSPSRVTQRLGERVAAGFIRGIALDPNRMDPIIEEYLRAFGALGALIGRGVGGGSLTGLEDRFEGIVRTILRLGRGQIQLISGFRTSAQQARLFARYISGVPGQALAAPPGRSKHERGLAVDWGGNRELYTRLSHLFGLFAPVRGEPWHWQPGWAGQRYSYYQQGAWELLRDELAFVHRGEMILPSEIARAVRKAVAAGQVGVPRVVRQASATGGATIINNFSLNVAVPRDVTDPFGFGRQVARGFESTLTERQVLTDARIA